MGTLSKHFILLNDCCCSIGCSISQYKFSEPLDVVSVLFTFHQAIKKSNWLWLAPIKTLPEPLSSIFSNLTKPILPYEIYMFDVKMKNWICCLINIFSFLNKLEITQRSFFYAPTTSFRASFRHFIKTAEKFFREKIVTWSKPLNHAKATAKIWC